MIESKYDRICRIIFALCLFSATFMAAQDLEMSDYKKQTFRIPMSDGVHLHTIVYSPKNTSIDYPLLLKISPWGSAPYEEEEMARSICHNPFMLASGYHFVFQDVRGRFMSEGEFLMTESFDENIPRAITDASTSFDYLLENVENNNGKIGVWGNSFRGYYAAMALLTRHPALSAVCPQSPVCDFYFDDFHENGAFKLLYWSSLDATGVQTPDSTMKWWPIQPFANISSRDNYDFYLNELGALSNSSSYVNPENTYWPLLVNHPDYDDFWSSRNPLPHFKDIKTSTMIVGGWNDMEDLYGPIQYYRSMKNLGAKNIQLVMGPWTHGAYRYEPGALYIGNTYHGDSLSYDYWKNIEFPFFESNLKSGINYEKAASHVYDSGAQKMLELSSYPPTTEPKTVFLNPSNQLGFKEVNAMDQYIEFVSDPSKPIPYSIDRSFSLYNPSSFVTEDQRFISSRPDVISFQSEILSEDIQVVGTPEIHLKVSTDHGDADWIVKLVDVYPVDRAPQEADKEGVHYAGYQQLVRQNVMRGRYRNSFSKPEAFVPDKKTDVSWDMYDVCHTFKKGHKIMIMVQSTNFPLIDRNPQKYVDNIFLAKDEDFEKAVHRVYLDSYLVLPIVND